MTHGGLIGALHFFVGVAGVGFGVCCTDHGVLTDLQIKLLASFEQGLR